MLLEARGLEMVLGSAGHKDKPTLFRGIDLGIDRGRIVGLTGPSGVGKSTLGNILLGLTRPTAGSVRWQGQEIFRGSKRPPASLRPRFQKLFQDPASSFYPAQSLMQSMLEVLGYHHPDLRKPEAKASIEAALPPLGLDPELLRRLPAQVSGGEIQRLALVRIGLVDPLFLVADEPTSRLDLSVQATTARLLATWARTRNMGLLFISHDRMLLSHLCDSILLLDSHGPDLPATLKPCQGESDRLSRGTHQTPIFSNV